MLGIIGAVNDNLFNLIELMHAIQAGGIFTGGAGFAAETRRQRTKLDRLFQIENLTAIKACQGNFAGSYQYAGILGDICLIASGGEITGANHALLGDQNGYNHRLIPLGHDAILSETQYGGIKQRPRPAHHIRATPRQFHPPLKIENIELFSQRDVVLATVLQRQGRMLRIGPGPRDDVVPVVFPHRPAWVGKGGQLQHDRLRFSFRARLLIRQLLGRDFRSLAVCRTASSSGLVPPFS